MPRRLKELSAFKTVRDLVINNSKEFKDKTAIIERSADQERSDYTYITYNDLFEDWKYLGHIFRRCGFDKNTRVALLGDNSYSLALSLLTLASGAGIPAAIDPRESKEIVCNCISSIGAEYAIADRKYKNLLPENVSVIYTDEILNNVASLRESEPETAIPPCDFDPDTDHALAVFSAGASGNPKAALFTSTQLYENVSLIRNEIHITHKDRFLSVMPLASYAELYIGLLFPMSRGAAVIYCKDDLSSKESIMASNIKNLKPTAMVVTPVIADSFYSMMWKTVVENDQVEAAQEFVRKVDNVGTVRKGVKLNSFFHLTSLFGSSIDFVICSRSILTKRVANGLRAFGMPVINVYGMAECPMIAIKTPFNPGSGEKSYVTSEVNIRIDRIGNENCGKVMVSGRRVSTKYANADDSGEWLYTGDLATLNENRELTVFGREHTALRSEISDRYIFPEQIERAITSEYGIVEARVYPKKTDNGYILAAKVRPEEAVLMNRGKDVTIEFVRETLRKVNSILLPYKKISELEVIFTPLERDIYHRLIREPVDKSVKISVPIREPEL